MQNSQSRTIFFSVADVSADQHTAAVITQLISLLPHLKTVGLGGPAMAQAGCKLLENTVDTSVMGLHAITHFRHFQKLLRQVKHFFNDTHPDLVVVVDSFAWNSHVAKTAQKAGIPVLYYIAPQLWAWAPWRIKKLKKTADRIACILPFEQEWFSDRGVQSDYVGHPLFDDFQKIPLPTGRGNLDKDFPTIVLLPGSRNQEIKHLWPPMQQVAKVIQKRYPHARFLVNTPNDAIEHALQETRDPYLDVEFRQSGIEAVTRHADLTLVASGTATLQVAAQCCPMIVMYYVHPLQWQLLGRWILNTEHIALVNILAKKEIVPEFIPFYREIDQVAQTALEFLDDENKRFATRKSLQKLIKPLNKPGTAKSVARMIKQMMPRYK